MTMANPMRRKLKNVINQYTDAQVKVREATSNDPWGPSSTLMSEVADLSYNVVAFSEVMQMIWKRLNDSGKNWRHVYKALVLLEYILKTGSEKVAQQCKENIYAIQTLRDFQYMEDNKDQGVNVREKAKQLVILLKDEEKLKQERAKALKAKERFAQNSTSISSTGGMQQSASMNFTRQHAGGSAPSLSGAEMSENAEGESSVNTETGRRLSTSDLEQARPSTAGEEELQLELALALSKEEADADSRKQRGDAVRLALALEESQKQDDDPKKKRTLVDIMGDSKQAPAKKSDDFWSSNATAADTRTNDPWAATSASEAFVQHADNDPWAPVGPTKSDPWSSVASTPAQNDPWATTQPGSVAPSPWGGPPGPPVVRDEDEFDMLMTRSATSPVMDDGLLDLGKPQPCTNPEPSDRSHTKTPQDFLGANSSLVNLDNLVTAPRPAATNPFASGTSPSNPFLAQQAAQPRPTLNQMQYQQRSQFAPQTTGLPQPLIPGTQGSTSSGHNPFM